MWKFQFKKYFLLILVQSFHYFKLQLPKQNIAYNFWWNQSVEAQLHELLKLHLYQT